MVIDLTDEDVFTIADAPQHLPRTRRGKKVHLSTIYRWINRGVAGVRLESVRVGGGMYTSREALQRFAERCTNPSTTPSRATPKARQRQIAQAETELSRAGI